MVVGTRLFGHQRLMSNRLVFFCGYRDSLQAVAPKGSSQTPLLVRFVSSSPLRSREDFSNNNNYNNDDTILPLYQRNKDRITMPRAALGLSAMNTAYWLWYTLDFIPAVNHSSVENLHIDPRIGWGALGLGIGINLITAIYPSLLISRMEYDSSKKQLLVYKHQLPLLMESRTALPFTLGDLTIDPSDGDLKKILGDYQGDWSKYKGHLALKPKNHTMPFLLEVQNGGVEIKNGELLLQAMLRPTAFSENRSGATKKKVSKVIQSKKKR